MLGILIPGVREVRAPLAAGSLLLIAVYLLLFDSAQAVVEKDAVSPALRSLYDVLGRTGLLVAAGVTAYLLGTVYTRVAAIQMRNLSLRLVVPVTKDEFVIGPPSRRLHFFAPFSRAMIRRIMKMCEGRDCHAEDVLVEIVVSGGKRLLIAAKDLYAEYDRLRSEIEFRLAVVPPALLLAVAVALQVPADLAAEILGVGVVAVFGVFVYADAIALNRQANSLYGHAVADGVVSTPSLDAAA